MSKEGERSTNYLLVKSREREIAFTEPFTGAVSRHEDQSGQTKWKAWGHDANQKRMQG